MTVLNRILWTLALGALATGVVLGFLPIADCGSAFSGNDAFTAGDGCDALRADQRQIPVALIGLGLTLAAAAIVLTSWLAGEGMRTARQQSGSDPA